MGFNQAYTRRSTVEKVLVVMVVTCNSILEISTLASKLLRFTTQS